MFKKKLLSGNMKKYEDKLIGHLFWRNVKMLIL